MNTNVYAVYACGCSFSVTYQVAMHKKKKRYFLAYHMQESYWKHDILGNKIHMNWRHSWMFPTAFPNN